MTLVSLCNQEQNCQYCLFDDHAEGEKAATKIERVVEVNWLIVVEKLPLPAAQRM